MVKISGGVEVVGEDFYDYGTGSLLIKKPDPSRGKHVGEVGIELFLRDSGRGADDEPWADGIEEGDVHRQM